MKNDFLKKNGFAIGAIVIIVIIVLIWLYSRKDKGANANQRTTTPTNTGNSNNNTSAAPLSSEADIKSFQMFANQKGVSPALTVDGKWGPKTNAAWLTWGMAWKSQATTTTTTNNSPNTPDPLIGKSVYAKLNGIHVYYPDGTLVAGDLSIGSYVGVVKKDFAHLYKWVNPLTFQTGIQFNNLKPWWSLNPIPLTDQGISNSYYEVQSNAHGTTYVLKANVKG